MRIYLRNCLEKWFLLYYLCSKIDKLSLDREQRCSEKGLFKFDTMKAVRVSFSERHLKRCDSKVAPYFYAYNFLF